ncbi:hypothetical protein AS034_09575 [[Bacillus] enclensis]|jgi:hypothetical protein|uniref:Small peptidoglycan-associated lipoprotein n=2 Tax=Rossellomorea TaxID=2837508 RepID=A0A0V8HHW5_9BACI|nr:hypothetical protein [[Bacillus] enclensis]QTC42258.1 hypothetical protein I7V34_03070 [Bacillus sp. V3]QWC24323.1 hypothetical protein KJK41_08420 [Bacillus haikouensis]KSU62363.1 hypothetical protein AS034_09575 [[Bacillus] enclensis]MBH9968422.1 hypothetical protein [[Bacillus] enclensis]SCC03357.1 hypothetical protein GA0061094_1989 [[Bacillus] enclensis]
MKHLLTLLMLASTALLLTSCNDLAADKVVLAEDRFIEKQIIFFTDERNISKEVAYYDAIIELKNEYPEDLKHLEVVNFSTDKSNPKIQSTSYPAIVVVDNNQVVTKITGKAHKNQIIKSVTHAISNW